MAPQTTDSTNISKRNLIIVLIVVFALILAVALRVGYIQIVKGEEYQERALSQQTSDSAIEAERGTIYDRNGEKLAQSVRCYTVYAYPSEIGKYDTKKEQKQQQKEVADALAKALKLDIGKTEKKIIGGSGQITIAKWLDRDEAQAVQKQNLSGVIISSSTKREYPNGTLAANVMGMVNDDNTGQSGLELEYNNYLSGIEGRVVSYTDTNGDKLSYSPKNERYYEAENGGDITTTVDLVIQSYTEEAIESVQEKTDADRVFAIAMDPETGDILAMAQTPTFDPNDPYEPASKSEKEEFDSMPEKEQSEYLSKMWRNPLICDVYEPGSVFKLLTTAAALEEGVTSMNDSFYCSGSLSVAGTTINCWNSGGHGSQTLKQAVGNSCNPVLMTLAGRLGITKFYDYLDNFGVTEKTGIDFPAEGDSILQDEDSAGAVGLATIGFGQGVAVTPIQLITAISSFGNEGKLMKPRLVKAVTDKETGKTQEVEPEIVRQTVSKETADEICEIMEYVVSEGGGGNAAVSGYRVGGKTGTANKAVNGGYSNYTYSSCLGMAPMSDPKITVLVIADSPKKAKFGSVTAAPAVSEILKKSLKYMNIQPDAKSTDSDEDDKVKVPDVVGNGADEAIGILAGKGLKYDMSDKAPSDDFIVVKQYPSAGSKVKKGTKVYLYYE